MSLFANSPLSAVVKVGKHRLAWDTDASPLQVPHQVSVAKTKKPGLGLGCIIKDCLAWLSKHLKEGGTSIPLTDVISRKYANGE